MRRIIRNKLPHVLKVCSYKLISHISFSLIQLYVCHFHMLDVWDGVWWKQCMRRNTTHALHSSTMSNCRQFKQIKIILLSFMYNWALRQRLSLSASIPTAAFNASWKRFDNSMYIITCYMFVFSWGCVVKYTLMSSFILSIWKHKFSKCWIQPSLNSTIYKHVNNI